MIKNLNNKLLPEGFKVLLPEEAHKEEFLSRKILDIFIKNGYLLVKTPLIEYEDNNLKTTNLKIKNIKHDPFILLEPDTKKLLVIRPDITPQIAKLASTKLNHIKRPLRLMYSGEVLRNIKNLYQSERQFKQIGAEIIGYKYNKGLLEIINITNNIFNNLNIKNIILDFYVPSLMRFLEKNLKFNKSDKKRIKEAIDNKDISLITKNKYKYLQQIIECSGTLSSAKENFKKSTFPKNINDILLKFFKTLEYIKKNSPNTYISVDISEGNSFFNYQNIGFKVYNKEDSNVIAIGGDYLLDNKESGIGITLIIENISSAFNYKKKNNKF